MKLNKLKREEIRMMFGGKCAYCGNDLPERGWHADHIKPIMRDGHYVRVEGKPYTHEYKQTGTCARPDLDCTDNIFPSCRACNINKGASSIDSWRRFIEQSVEALRRDYGRFRHAERFGLVQAIDKPVTFWFEKYRKNSEVTA